jgi:lipopolysaccharide/colanic/teichoic acid biosynthesis glycosyltransferase
MSVRIDPDQRDGAGVAVTAVPSAGACVGASARARVVLRAALKRTLDVVIAMVALVILLPLLLLLALLVVLDSPGPLFFRVDRVGRGGRPLRIVKFRKMRADAKGGALTLADDERFTRLGAWLARTKLDELPQLWHVLRGDMSLVGPRPESPSFVARFPADYEAILRVRPGLTGYTQIAFVRESSILDPNDPQGHYLTGLLPQKVQLDTLYAARLGTRRDLRILGATIVTLVLRQPVAVNRGTGALTLRRRRADVATTAVRRLPRGAPLEPASTPARHAEP